MGKNYHEMTFREIIGGFSDNEKNNFYNIMSAFIEGRVPDDLEYESWLNNFDYPIKEEAKDIIYCPSCFVTNEKRR